MLQPIHRRGGVGFVLKLERGVRGLGDTAAGTAQGLIQQDLLSWVNYPGGGGTADQFAAAVGGDAAAFCANWPDSCVGVDVNALAADAAAAYAAWLAGQPLPQSAVSTMPGYTAAVPPGYQTNPYTGAIEPIPGYNVLYSVAPTPVYVPPQPVQNALNPPTGTAPPVNPATVTINQAPAPPAAGTTQNTTVTNAQTPSWFMDSTTIGGMSIPNLALVGAAAVALLLVVGKK